MEKKNVLHKIVIAALLAIVVFAGCSKPNYKQTTTTDVNITGYLDEHPDTFSLFREILEVTGTAGYLNAYGAYTCFAVTNDGVKQWMSEAGVTSIASADVETLKDLVRFHLLEDTIATSSFTDGKLSTPTMYGQYLITGAEYVDGVSYYTVNRQALIVQSNVRVGNGIIHVIDNMLTPATQTLAEAIESNPNYSIFTQAMKATGYYDLLNTVSEDTASKWMTVIAESDQALADSGITSYEVLRDKYSQLGDPTNTGDSLNVYMAYHIIDGLYFLGDLINYSSVLTNVPEEVISIELDGEDIVLNRIEINGETEPGVTIIRDSSDNAASNGVWHSINGHTMVKYRKPTAVYWDVCTFPEIMNQPAYFRLQTCTLTRETEADRPIASINWEYISASASQQVVYYRNATPSSSTLSIYNVFTDHLCFPFGNNRPSWYEFTTPVIIKGRYKVWICYVAQNSVGANVFVNGTQMQRSINFNEYMPSGTTEELESIGWKNYTTASSPGRHNARLVGLIDITTTGTQVLRFEHNGTGGNYCRLDMVHFIPYDEDQTSPRFATDGTAVY
ncbi:MAG: fasciclin domain-containing protein [Edaphocola sp.]